MRESHRTHPFFPESEDETDDDDEDDDDDDDEGDADRDGSAPRDFDEDQTDDDSDDEHSDDDDDLFSSSKTKKNSASSGRQVMYDAFFDKPDDDVNASVVKGKGETKVTFQGQEEGEAESEAEDDGEDEENAVGAVGGDVDFGDVSDDENAPRKDSAGQASNVGQKFDLFKESDDEDDGEGKKSSNEMRLEKLKKKTRQFEEQNLGQKVRYT